MRYAWYRSQSSTYVKQFQSYHLKSVHLKLGGSFDMSNQEGVLDTYNESTKFVWECKGSISDFYVKQVFCPNGSEGHRIWFFQTKNPKSF